MPLCTKCGQDNPEVARFCLACGTALEFEVGRARKERKVVSVLFCDLVGSTARAEQMDPEDVSALLSAYHARVKQELERFGGTVEKFVGDAVMALFGAPTAHEDDSERAVRAALAIRDWATGGGDFQVRIAVTRGEALVALGARLEAGEGMASGDVVNTAARLQNAAPVDGILVDETTQRSTRDVIDYGERHEVIAKGKAAPVRAWEAVAARSRLGVDVRRYGATPLVGRERELELLTGTLARVRAEHSPQLLTLVGPPGIGKSRLVFELMQRVEQGPELVTWRQGRSLPYGEGVSFWALGEMIKAEAGILESDPPEEVSAKVHRAVSALLADQKDAEWVERHLRPLLGVTADGGVSREPRGGVRGLAALSRSACRAAASRARLRRPALGGRGPARLRRPPRRMGERRGDPRSLHGAAGAARPTPGLGRREVECVHTGPVAAGRARDDSPARRGARAVGTLRRDAIGPA